MSLQLSTDFSRSAAQLKRLDHPLATPTFDRSAGAAVLDRLAKALVAAGVSPEKLERRADNEQRLNIVAHLFELSSTPAAELPQPVRKAPAALPKWRLKRVVEYVDANLSETITLVSLASAAGMSRMYFASQFRVATGMRPHDYLLQKRIERAQRLLLTTSDPLVEIALSVGFQTQAHFTTIFKKIVGNTPLRWRREQQV